MSIKNDGHYFCRAGGNRPDGLNEPVTFSLQGAGVTDGIGFTLTTITYLSDIGCLEIQGASLNSVLLVLYR
ncbi:Phage minor tail protein [Escherichia coli IS25]|nr:Phage minor tail protein [Escherichia coli IS25]